jgi:hypothetical protein
MQRTIVLSTLVLGIACSNATPSTNDAATPTDTSAQADSGGPTLDCAHYCATSLANCATMEVQYSSLASCMGVCAAFTPGVVGDTSGNTLACRLYHTTAAATMPGMKHCIHGGPAGYAICGTSQCEAFCQIAASACTGANQQWPSTAACMSDCAMFPGAVPNVPAGAPDYSTAVASGNSFACRMYHLTVAASDAASAAMHCPHIVLASPVCM